MSVLALLVVMVGSASAAPLGQITEFPVSFRPFGYPQSITQGPDGNMWFTGATIGKITPSGQTTAYATGLSDGNVLGGISSGPDGNLWFTVPGTRNAEGQTPPSMIGRVTTSGQITEFSAGLKPGSVPVEIARGPDGDLWFTDNGNSVPGGSEAIGRITTSGQITEFTSGLSSGDLLGGIAAGADGNMWFTETDGNTPAIGTITPSGQITEFTAGLQTGSLPGYVAAGADGNMWFTDEGNTPAVGRITPTGQITEFSDGLHPGSLPIAITPGADGNLWFTDDDRAAPAIGRITTAGLITEYSHGLNAGSEPDQIAPGADGNLWFTDPALTPAIGEIGTGVGSAPPVVVTGSASAVSGNSATVHGSVNPEGSAVTSCAFDWGTSAGVYTHSVPCTAQPGLGSAPVSVSAALSGLVPGTTYQYRVVAGNANGTTKGSDQLFATPAPGGASTLGNASVGDEISSFQSGLERVNPYALYWPGVAQSLSIYLQPTGQSGTQQVQLMLYADQNGTPGALLGTTAPFTFGSSSTGGWYTQALRTPVTLTDGTYWIGVLTGGKSGVAGWRYDDTGLRETRYTPFAAGPTNPFGATDNDTAVMSLYANLVPVPHQTAAMARRAQAARLHHHARHQLGRRVGVRHRGRPR